MIDNSEDDSIAELNLARRKERERPLILERWNATPRAGKILTMLVIKSVTSWVKTRCGHDAAVSILQRYSTLNDKEIAFKNVHLQDFEAYMNDCLRVLEQNKVIVEF
jgi:hypothetical protein